MTVVAFTSVKGSPGVTTLACLVAATWPAQRRVMVVECDPSGADLAARFGLSSKRGWSSFATSSRRAHAIPVIAPHLQQLPGGLDVLVGTRSPVGNDPATVGTMVSSAASDPDGPWDLLVDLGRILPGRPSPGGWVEHADTVVVVLRSDAASVLQIRDASPTLLAGCLERTGLVVVPTGGYPSSEIQRFTGLPVIGEIPYDPAAAAIATDGHGSRRRLSRSSLVSSAFRLGSNLIGPVTQRESSDDCPDQSSRLGSEPPSDGNPQKIRAARRVWNALGRVPDAGTSRLSETFSENAREEVSR